MRLILEGDSSDVMGRQSLTTYCQGLPGDVQARAKRYHQKRDAYNFVLGRRLLQSGLRELGRSDDLSNMRYEENGKPQLDGIHFNISHSGHQVVCALSTEGVIGIDVEVRSKLNLDHFKDYFSGGEWKDILTAKDSIGRFYFYWTRKEAVIKALGVNLSWLHEIDLDARGDFFTVEGKKWKLEEIDLGKEGVYCVLCY